MKYINIFSHQPFGGDRKPFGKPIVCASDVFETAGEAAQDAYENYQEEYQTTLEWGGAPESARQRDFRDDGTFEEMEYDTADQLAHESWLRVPR